MAKEKGHIHLIIGASKLGSAIAVKHALDSKYVTVIDKDPDAKYKLGDNYPGAFICGDAALLSTLEEANVEKAREVVIVTDSDDTNIYLANLIHNLYEKNNIIIRLNDQTKVDLLDSHVIKTINNFLESFQQYQHILAIKKEDE